MIFDPVGSQFGLVNINMGNSSDPGVEAEVLARVASYGKQLGRISDALSVLVKHFEPKNAQEKHAIDAFTRLLEEIATVKKDHATK